MNKLLPADTYIVKNATILTSEVRNILIKQWINRSIRKIHPPDIGRSGCISSLRNEIDITAVSTPYRTQIIGRMIGQLRKITPVGPAYENIGIEVDEIRTVDPIAAHEQQPLPVG